MFFPEGQVRVFLYGEPVSMRLSIDWTGLKLLLEGIEPKRVRKRYQKNTVFIGKNTP